MIVKLNKVTKCNHHLKCNQTENKKKYGTTRTSRCIKLLPDNFRMFLMVIKLFHKVKFKDIIDVLPFSIFYKQNFAPPRLYPLSFTKTELIFYILIYEFWACGFIFMIQRD